MEARSRSKPIRIVRSTTSWRTSSSPAIPIMSPSGCSSYANRSALFGTLVLPLTTGMIVLGGQQSMRLFASEVAPAFNKAIGAGTDVLARKLKLRGITLDQHTH